MKRGSLRKEKKATKKRNHFLGNHEKEHINKTSKLFKSLIILHDTIK